MSLHNHFLGVGKAHLSGCPRRVAFDRLSEMFSGHVKGRVEAVVIHGHKSNRPVLHCHLNRRPAHRVYIQLFDLAVLNDERVDAKRAAAGRSNADKPTFVMSDGLDAVFIGITGLMEVIEQRVFATVALCVAEPLAALGGVLRALFQDRVDPVPEDQEVRPRGFDFLECGGGIKFGDGFPCRPRRRERPWPYRHVRPGPRPGASYAS